MKLETENFRNVERETAEDLNRSCRTASDSAQLRSNDSIRFTIKSIAGGLSTKGWSTSTIVQRYNINRVSVENMV